MLKSKFVVHVQYRPFRWLGAIFFAASVLGAGNILAIAAAPTPRPSRPTGLLQFEALCSTTLTAMAFRMPTKRALPT